MTPPLPDRRHSTGADAVSQVPQQTNFYRKRGIVDSVPQAEALPRALLGSSLVSIVGVVMVVGAVVVEPAFVPSKVHCRRVFRNGNGLG